MSNQITVLPVCLPGSATVRYGWTIQELHPIIPVAADAYVITYMRYAIEADQIVLAIVHDGQNIILSAGWQTAVQFVHGVMRQPFK